MDDQKHREDNPEDTEKSTGSSDELKQTEENSSEMNTVEKKEIEPKKFKNFQIPLQPPSYL